MIKENIADIIKERIRISDETQDNWDYGIEQCWKKYVDILSADIEKSTDFFLNHKVIFDYLFKSSYMPV